ncbi:MAG: MFS transporter [Patescibacteria group bacterium]|jgi:MFS family permease
MKNTSLTKAFYVLDLVIASGLGLFFPILALLIKDYVPGATIFSIALAQSVFLISKAGFSLLFAYFNNAISPAKRNRLGLMLGYLITAVVPLVYASAHSITTIYIAQVILGLGLGLAEPSWKAAFALHSSSDYKKYSGAYEVILVLACALTAALGGLIAYYSGFKPVLYMSSAACVIAAVGVMVSVPKK